MNGYYIFDFDGTLANINHRLKYIEDGCKDWDAFFEACDQDEPVLDVIQIFRDLVEAGQHVEIWSGRSAQVEEKSNQWLDKHIGRFDYGDSIGGSIWEPASNHLTHMRPEGDYRPDTVLKEEWLHAFHQEHGFFPTMIFDDRPSVVKMWRDNGVTCAQVATWDDRKRMIKPFNPNEPRLILTVGPSGAGKSYYVRDRFRPCEIVSSDTIREELCGDFKRQDRNNEVFQALDMIVEARLRAGLRVCVDATNLRNADRKKLVNLALDIDSEMKIKYLVIDRPLEDKQRDAGWRAVVKVKGDQPLIEYHANTFKQNLKAILNGDGFDNVVVEDTRDDRTKNSL